MRISDWSSDVCSSDLEEKPGIDAEEEDLKDRIERDERSDILIVALCELVPHDHHCDAARETDQDQASHIFRLVREEDDREREHQHRPDDRSEEHTSELQSLMSISYAVFCLKKQKRNKYRNSKIH